MEIGPAAVTPRSILATKSRSQWMRYQKALSCVLWDYVIHQTQDTAKYTYSIASPAIPLTYSDLENHSPRYSALLYS